MNSYINKQLTYNKAEKLKSRKLIEHLFDKGNSISLFPLKVLYIFGQKLDTNLQAGVTVSSRRFKKAVQRNKIKRLMREAYRVQKSPLQNALEENRQSAILFFIYIGKETPVYADLHSKMKTVLQKLFDTLIRKSDK